MVVKPKELWPLKVILLSTLLIGYNAALSVLPGRLHSMVYVPANMLVAVLLLAWSNLADGSPLAELGLARGSHNLAGAIWGMCSGLIVGLPVMFALLALRPYLPPEAVREFAPVGVIELLWRLLIWIPLGTVVLEETAFRGVLLSLLQRTSGLWRGVLLSSLVFGLWHVGLVVRAALAGSLAKESALLGFIAVAACAFVAGIGLALVRLRTSTLVGSMMMHLAVNSLVTVGLWQPR